MFNSSVKKKERGERKKEGKKEASKSDFGGVFLIYKNSL